MVEFKKATFLTVVFWVAIFLKDVSESENFISLMWVDERIGTHSLHEIYVPVGGLATAISGQYKS